MASIKALEKKYYALLPYPAFEALLGLAIKKSREYIFAHPEYCLSLTETLRFFYFRTKYNHGYSIATLRGTKEFFGLDFLVTKNTLVPRPDTEILVEAVIEKIKKTSKNILLIDVGTGTGCIPISILKKFPDEKIKTIATDISLGSLKVAKKNAEFHNAVIHFLHGNLLAPLFGIHGNQITDGVIMITANLPYLTAAQFRAETSIQREPYHALVAEEHGLALYRELLEQLTEQFLPQHANEVCLYFEIDPSQTNSILVLIKKYLPTASTQVHKDLSGHERLIAINLPTRS